MMNNNRYTNGYIKYYLNKLHKHNTKIEIVDIDYSYEYVIIRYLMNGLVNSYAIQLKYKHVEEIYDEYIKAVNINRNLKLLNKV